MKQLSLERCLPWINWGIATTFVLFQFFLQTAAGVMVDAWARDFHLSHLAVSNLSAMFFYTYVLCQVPVGIAYDRFGARRILLFAAFLLAIGCYLLYTAESYGLALLARAVMGVGSSFGFVGMLYASANWFPAKRFALMVGLAETLGMMGVALGEILLAWLMTNGGWRSIMLYCAIAGGTVAVLVYFFVSDNAPYKAVTDHANEKKHQLSLKESLLTAMQCKSIWFAGLYGFAMFGLVNVFTSLWGVPFLRDQYGVDLHLAASLTSMIFVGIAIGGPFNGWLSAKLGVRQPIMLGFCLMTLCLMSAAIYLPLPIVVLFLTLLLAGFFCSSYILAFDVVKDAVPKAIQAAALALCNMLVMFSAPALQPLVGSLMEFGLSLQMALIVIPLSLIMAFLCASGLRDKRACVKGS